MTYIIVDTETTGLVPERDKIIEIAAVWDDERRTSFVSPEGVVIPPDVSAIHLLTNRDVDDAPRIDQILKEFDLPNGILVAHVAKFDKSFLPQFYDREWLCTHRCALHLWPDAPNHKNMTLRYYLGLELDLPKDLMPHRALYDCLVTKAILEKMLGTHALIELMYLQTQPVVLKTAKFGKHRGESWESIPNDYKKWVARQEGMDPDVLHTCRHYLS